MSQLNEVLYKIKEIGYKEQLRKIGDRLDYTLNEAVLNLTTDIDNPTIQNKELARELKKLRTIVKKWFQKKD